MSAAKDVIVDRNGGGELIDEEDKLAAVHPVFVIPWGAVNRCHHHFSRKQGF